LSGTIRPKAANTRPLMNLDPSACFVNRRVSSLISFILSVMEQQFTVPHPCPINNGQNGKSNGQIDSYEKTWW
jgi:hypothetical protein